MTPHFAQYRHALAATAVALALVACGGGGDGGGGGTDPGTPPGNTVALTANGRVISFDRATPSTLVTDRTLAGLQSGESLVGLDVRPADGLIYALSSQGRLYTLNAGTGVVALKATLSATAGDDSPYAGLSGATFGVDFNPVADRLRVVSNTGQSLRINVDNGATITDGNINGVAGAVITAAGYTNSFAATTSTQLFVIDAAAGTLYLQNPPNDGTLSLPRSLGITGTAENGFDIDPVSNTGYAALFGEGRARLHTVVLATGATSLVGVIGSGETLTGLALLPTRAAAQAIVLTSDARLATFNPLAPNTFTSSVAIGGLMASETVLGIDFRPANRKLYALTSTARLLTIDPVTGASTVVATLAADPTDTSAPFAALPSGLYSVDFNPVADRLRVISDSGLNLRINVDTGATITDGTINRAAGPASVVGAAYTNSFAGATATRLFDVDALQDVLAEQTPPNDGTLVNVGALTVGVTGATPLDIAGGDNGLVLAAVRTGASGPFSLYTIALASGAATLYRNTSGNAALSQIGGANGPAVVDLAIQY